MVIYTDGIVEGRNKEQEEYGEERLREMLKQTYHLEADDIKYAIIHDLNEFCQDTPIHDDQTLMVIKFRNVQPNFSAWRNKMAMKITHEIKDKTITIRLNGELDASSSVLLDEELSKPEIMLFNKVLVDCENLNYISSAGLGVFISHLQRFEDAQIKLIFFNMQEKVRNVFEILGLDLLMTIVSTYDEAMTVANE